MASHILDLNRAFTTLTVPTITKFLEYHMKKSNGDDFTPLELTLVTRHWEDTLASRVLTRNIFAVCSSLFVVKDASDMYMFVRARDMSEEALKFLYREIIENNRNALDVAISDWGLRQDDFISRQRRLCREADDQHHYFHERVRFVKR